MFFFIFFYFQIAPLIGLVTRHHFIILILGIIIIWFQRCAIFPFFFLKMGWNNRKIWKWIIEQFRENCEFQTKFVLNFNVLTQRECHEVTGYYLRFFQLINHNLFYAWIHNFCELYKQMWPQNFPQRNLYIMHCSLESIVFSGGRFENL